MAIKLRPLGCQLLIVVLSITACTTTIAYRQLSLDKSPYAALKNKSVAVVMDPTLVPKSVTTTSETQTFEFKNMDTTVQDALKGQLEFAGSQVQVVSSQSVTGYDFYLRPQVTVRSVYDFWTYGCLATYKVEVFSKSGTLVASASGQGKRNFMFTGQAEDKCNEAFKDLVGSVNEKALVSVSR
ncbi:MAG: hypothetical protein ACXVA9_04390 [Bdellovibrionales bacterium]